VLEPLPKFPVCTIQRRSRLHAALPREVHDGKQQVANLGDQLIAGRITRHIGIRIRPLGARARSSAQFRFNLGKLLPHLLQRTTGIGPVKTNRGGPLL
jgi:hypothetical protein